MMNIVFTFFCGLLVVFKFYSRSSSVLTSKQWLRLLTLLLVKEAISTQYFVNTFNLVNSAEELSVHRKLNTSLVLLGSLYVSL